jgi:hypothetical protein
LLSAEKNAATISSRMILYVAVRLIKKVNLHVCTDAAIFLMPVD